MLSPALSAMMSDVRSSSRVPTWEEQFISHERRVKAALHNVANDACQFRNNPNADPTLAEKFWRLAERLYPGYEGIEPKVDLPLIYQRVPIACNVSCDGCFTGANFPWKHTETHVTFEDLVDTARQAADLGCEVTKINGEGEPGLYKQLADYVEAVKKFGIKEVIICTNLYRDTQHMRGALQAGARIYGKHWTLSPELMHSMTDRNYDYVRQGHLGPAPSVLYALFQDFPNQVGIQVAFRDINMQDAFRIRQMLGPVLPVYMEPYIGFPIVPDACGFATNSCAKEPIYTAWSASISSHGIVGRGGFSEEGISLREGGGLHAVMEQSFVIDEGLFSSRYVRPENGCHCMIRALKESQEGQAETSLVDLNLRKD